VTWGPLPGTRKVEWPVLAALVIQVSAGTFVVFDSSTPYAFSLAHIGRENV